MDAYKTRRIASEPDGAITESKAIKSRNQANLPLNQDGLFSWSNSMHDRVWVTAEKNANKKRLPEISNDTLLGVIP